MSYKIRWSWAEKKLGPLAGKAPTFLASAWSWLLLPSLGAALALSGASCSQRMNTPAPHAARTDVVVIAPVINLSDSRDFDPLQVTDILAAAVTETPGFATIPVNLTLAELAQRGKSVVDSPAEAADLARAMNADGTLVAAITAYSPYEPLKVGLVMQWYPASAEEAPRPVPGTGEPSAFGEPADAAVPSSAQAVGDFQAATSMSPVARPTLQVQRIYYAADEAVRDEVKRFADARDESDSPYGWRRFLRSQRDYLRYCTWSAFQPISSQLRPELIPTQSQKKDAE